MAGMRGNKRKRAHCDLVRVQEAPPSQPSLNMLPMADSLSESEDSGQSEQDVLDSFGEATAAPVEALNAAAADATAFLLPSQQMSGLARQAAKALYDYTASLTMAAAGGSQRQTAQALMPHLHVTGFDAEQIWLQLDLASAHVVRRARRLLKKAGTEPELLTPEMDEDLEDLLKGGVPSDGDLSGLDSDDLDLSDPQAASDEDAGLTDEDEGEAENMGEAKAKRSRPKADKSLLPTEDRFLKLDDLENFLLDSERAAALENGDEAEDHLGEDDDDEEEEGSADEDLMLNGGDIENDSDADLDALLEDANRLIGRPSTSHKRAKSGRGHVRALHGDDEEEDEEEQDIMYEDFWGSGVDQQGGAGRSSRRQDARDSRNLDMDVADEEDDLSQDELDEDGNLEDDLDDIPDEEQMDEGDDGMGIFSNALDHTAQPLGTDQDQRQLRDDDSTAIDKTGNLSTHERQQQRMQERIAKLEAQNMAEKDWFMSGEAGAAKRPLNSALELDLDFERQVRPPPQPTEEATASLEDLIKKRIADQLFDDPPKVVPPQPEKQKVELELQDKKSHKGLGEVYEEEYVAAASGLPAAEDKDNAVRQEARSLMKELFAKLDALSHFHFAPKPVIEEMSVRADVPALAMEEIAPQVASEAAMRAPEEVYKAEQQGAPRAPEELTREERSAARQKRKRAGKKQKAQQVDDKRAVNPLGNIIGVKSEKALAAKSGKKSKKALSTASTADTNGAKFSYSKSGAVFKKLQDERDAAAAGTALKGAADTQPVSKRAASFKL